MKQTVRIIGGKYRGKKLNFPAVQGLRPTPDRVKETLFNWLMHDIRGARCLDAFAGSGGLGFEAVSRGAAEVTMLDVSRAVIMNLQAIAKNFCEKITILQKDACHYLQQAEEPFDIIFLDPPFASDYLDRCIELIVNRKSLCAGGLLYIESPREVLLPTESWHLLKKNHAGQVYYLLYEKI